jgi:hypothetical protein
MKRMFSLPFQPAYKKIGSNLFHQNMIGGDDELAMNFTARRGLFSKLLGERGANFREFLFYEVG